MIHEEWWDNPWLFVTMAVVVAMRIGRKERDARAGIL